MTKFNLITLCFPGLGVDLQSFPAEKVSTSFKPEGNGLSSYHLIIK